MISVLINAWKEPTVKKAIEAFQNQTTKEKYEIIVIAPDKETLDVAKQFKGIKILKDEGKGKPAALNILFKEAKGNIWILSDGDVYVSNNAIEELIKPFNDPQVGAVTGRPISLNPRDNILGYWSHLLTDEGAHRTRMQKMKNNEFIVVSGYLYAMRNVIKEIPPVSLADDTMTSHMLNEKGYKIKYAPEAEVYVKFPTTFKDWLKQKKRSAGGHQQVPKYFKNPPKSRSLIQEIIHGWYRPIFYAKNIKEFIWSLVLYPTRLYLWYKIKKDIKKDINEEEFKKIWCRIETTK